MSLFGGILKTIGTIGKTALSIVPGVGPYLSGQEANAANKHMLTDQQRFSIDMWNAQNAYNDPSAVMTRLQRAGLNPNMAYGEIGGGRAGAVSIPAAPDMKPVPALSNGLADFQQVVNQQAQNALIRSNTEKVSAEAERAKSDAKYARYENDMLMSQGLLKSDSPLVKPVGRVNDYVTTRIVKPVGDAISKSSLWEGVQNIAERFGRGLSQSSVPGWRTRQVERYGKGGSK